MIALILILALVGFLVYCVVTYIPMPDIFRKGIIVIAVIGIVLYLVRLFGIDIPIPHK